MAQDWEQDHHDPAKQTHQKKRDREILHRLTGTYDYIDSKLDKIELLVYRRIVPSAVCHSLKQMSIDLVEQTSIRIV